MQIIFFLNFENNILYSGVQIFPVNEAMIRSRAEHNEGILGTLEELSMHMLHIEKLEHFDKLCKKLKILLLQNNIVSKIGTSLIYFLYAQLIIYIPHVNCRKCQWLEEFGIPKPHVKQLREG